MSWLNMSLRLSACVLVIAAVTAGRRPFSSKDTIIDFKSHKVRSAVETLTKAAQVCTLKVKAMSPDVQAYFTNTPPQAKSGKCFAACMLEAGGILKNDEINRDKLIDLAAKVNGQDSGLVKKLTTVSRFCLENQKLTGGKCEIGASYNNCLNENMPDFGFPQDTADEILSKMPFRLTRFTNNNDHGSDPNVNRMKTFPQRVLWTPTWFHPRPSRDIIYGLSQREKKLFEEAMVHKNNN